MYSLKSRLHRLLRWSEKYTKTDMVYLTKNSVWLIAGQILSSALALALAVAFGHLASQETYGNYKYILSVIGLFSSLSLAGIGPAVTQATAQGHDGSLRQGFWLSLRWSGMIVTLSLLGALYYLLIAHNIFLAAALCLSAFFVPLINSFSLFDAFLIGKQQFKRDTIYTTINNAVPVVALIISLFFTQRAVILIVVYLVANTLADAFFYILSRKQEENTKTDSGVFSYSAHLSVMTIINTIADKIDSLVVFALLGPAQLAIYSYAIAMPEQIKGILKILGPLSLAKFTQRKISEIKENIWTRVRYLAIGIALITFLYIAAAPVLFKVLFPAYTESVFYSQIYALSLLLAVTTPMGIIFQSHKKIKELYIASNSSSLFLIIAIPLLTYYFGVIGAIMGQIAYRIFGAMITTFFFLRFKD